MNDTPRYVVDEAALLRNLHILQRISEEAGCRILLAQKAFALTDVYPLCARFLSGTTASSLFEARLGHDFFGGETHIFNPAYDPRDFPKIVRLADHIVFNSTRQATRFRDVLNGTRKCPSIGIRVNPGYSEVTTPCYDPCRPGSRLGCGRESLTDLDGVEGLHFHCLCEQGADVLERVLAHFEERYGDLIPRMKWVNFGGGHHITRPGYDRRKLVSLVRRFRKKYGTDVYLEPGEAVALNAGTLEATVLDVFTADGVTHAILDASAACHMPDTLEMPYRPRVVGSGMPGEKPYTYRFGGATCLAGDTVGDYSFPRPLKPGARVVFEDMAIYTMVKNNTFNGVNLPSVCIRHTNGTVETVRRYGYRDFVRRS